MRLSDIVRNGQRAGDPVTTRPAPGAEAGPGPPRARDLASAPPAPETAPPAAGPADEDGRLPASERLFQHAAERIRQVLAVRSKAPFSIAQAEQAVEILLQSLETSDALVMTFFRGPAGEGSLDRKAVNACILSLKMGIELGYPRDQLRQLGLAALFCDIGTTLAPEDVLASSAPLTDAERAGLRTHQLEAGRLLEKLAPGYQWIDEVISRRYERERPYQAGNRHEEYAAIVHLADIYRSLVHPRAARERVGPLDALKEILERRRALFPDRILKALIRAMSTYPVGSLVRLNSGDVARVVERSKEYPLRPVIEVLLRRGKRLPAPLRVDLAATPLLYIRESLVEEHGA